MCFSGDGNLENGGWGGGLGEREWEQRKEGVGTGEVGGTCRKE